MKKNNVKGSVIKILVVAFVILVVYLLFIWPLIKFNQNEDALLNGAKRYYELNSQLLPREGEVKTLVGVKLLDETYVDDLRTAYNGDSCDLRHSFVKVTRKEGNYSYYVYLKCGMFSSNIDHTGPVINLNGSDTLNVERNTKFKDPGVKSVIDNTDGTMKKSEVDVRGNVDTSKNGTYTLTYTASDSLENTTTVARKVIVSQNLSRTVEKDTDSDNVYKDGSKSKYVKFSGQLYRIYGLDDDGNTKIVATEDVGHSDFNSLKDYLNAFYDTLDSSSKKLVVTNYNFCSSTVSSKYKDSVKTCNKKKFIGNAGLLSINEYNIASKEGDGFLYPDTINWTSNSLNSKKAWTVREFFFGQDSKYLDYNKNYNFGIRPVLVIKKNTKVMSGSGTAADPYIIDNFKSLRGGTSVSKLRAGEYITYGKQLFRVSSSKSGVKVISNNVYVINNDLKDTTYSPTKTGTIGYLIENEISKQIRVKIFVKHKIVVPIYSGYATYNGKTISSKSFNVKFSAPSMYDLYSASYNPTWYIESSKKYNAYFSSNNGTIYYSKLGTVTPSTTKIAGYLRSDATVVSGTGTENDPYNISY